MTIGSEIGDHLKIEPEVLTALGLTKQNLEGLGLRSFFDLVTEKGFDVTVSTHRAVGHGNLSITMSPPPQKDHTP